MEKGGINFSLWNRSFLYDQQFLNQKNVHETIFHFDLSQVITNYGMISAWVDGLSSDKGQNIARFYLNWSGFKIGNVKFNAKLGDSYLQFTNLESRFINMFHPYLYFRGANLMFSAPSYDLTFWGGKTAQLRGLLGSTYEIGDQNILGFKARYKAKDRLIIGGGIIHTENEENNFDETSLKKNNIFLLDSEYKIFSWLKFLGEYKLSNYLENDKDKTKGDSFYRIGPIIKTEKFDIEANYRYVGSSFRFVSHATQIEEDEKGFFSTLRYRASRSLTLFGGVDRFRDNVEEDPQKRTIDTFYVFSGFSLFSRFFPDITVRLNASERKSREEFQDSINKLNIGTYVQVSKRLGSFFPYIRHMWRRYEDKLSPEGDFSSSTTYLGLRHSFRRSSSFWLEGILDQRYDYMKEKTRQDVSLRTGLRHSFSRKMSLYSEVFYRRSGLEESISNLDIYLGVNYELPWEIGFKIDFRTHQPLNQKRQGSNYSFTVKLDKRFKWGAPTRILGKIAGKETVWVGNIEGFVFEDKNRNMIKEQDEKGIPGINVILEDGSAIKTDSSGRYKFSNVAEGNHRVRMEERKIPANFFILKAPSIDIKVERKKTHKACFSLVSGAFICGKVIEDANRNDKIDPDEKGLENVLILLKPLIKEEEEKEMEYMEKLVLNTYTDKEGNYIFDNIFPGEYELIIDEETLPKGAKLVTETPIKITLQSGQKLEGKDLLVKPRKIIFQDFSK